jgi:uncharacterized protein (DUF433 family)
MNGQPCIRGTRLTVRRVVEAVAIYPDRADLVRNYPELEPDDVLQALAFAAANLEDSAAETLPDRYNLMRLEHRQECLWYRGRLASTFTRSLRFP